MSNFNISLVFVSKIKSNFHYKKMTGKIYGNLQGKYKNSVFSDFKNIQNKNPSAFSKFDFKSTITKKNTRGYVIVLK